MIYLLDSSVLITANNLYYPLDRVPEFWGWLRHNGEQGNIKIPLETYEEIKEGRDSDLLFAWIKEADTKRDLLLTEQVDPTLVDSVITQGYAADLTDIEIEQIGRDPFLIAYALADVGVRCVVTTEVSKPTKQRQNRRVPDVCGSLGVSCCDTFSLLRALNFNTSWQSRR